MRASEKRLIFCLKKSVLQEDNLVCNKEGIYLKVCIRVQVGKMRAWVFRAYVWVYFKQENRTSDFRVESSKRYMLYTVRTRYTPAVLQRQVGSRRTKDHNSCLHRSLGRLLLYQIPCHCSLFLCFFFCLSHPMPSKI